MVLGSLALVFVRRNQGTVWGEGLKGLAFEVYGPLELRSFAVSSKHARFSFPAKNR